MTAVVVLASASFSPWLFLLGGGIAVTVAVWALLAYLSRPKRMTRRDGFAAKVLDGLRLVLLIALVLAWSDLILMNPCKRYTPADWQYYVEGCFWP